MELEYANFNGDIVLEINFNLVEFFILKKTWKLSSKMHLICWFFKKMLWLLAKQDAP